MTTKQLDRLGCRWYNIGIAEVRRVTGSSAGFWSKTSPATRAGWRAVVRHALKTVNRKKR